MRKDGKMHRHQGVRRRWRKEESAMSSKIVGTFVLALIGVAVQQATAQSFRVQCPASTITHPTAANNNSEPAYTAATTFVSTNPAAPANGYLVPSAHVNGAIKCQQISGGDGYASMGDGTQTYMFSFGPLSGLADMRSEEHTSELQSPCNLVCR